MNYELSGKRIWVAGHRGMVGGAVLRRLERENCEVITAGRDELNLLDQSAVQIWLEGMRPDVIIIAAAKVGGIMANSTYPADFLYQNLMIETNIIHSAHLSDVDRLIFLGSSCIYPKEATIPIEESSLLTGPLEQTNEWFAVAKIAGIKLAQSYRIQYGRNYISAMLTNLYGPGDSFDLNNGHVLPALIRKFHEAKQSGDDAVTMWGTGKPRREFLHCDDCADALVYLLKIYNELEHINVGSGTDISILELAQLVCETVGFDGRIDHDLSKPDGTMRKLMNADKLKALGWVPTASFKDGIAATYRDWLNTLS